MLTLPNKLTQLSLAAVFVLFLMPFAASANTVFRTGDSMLVDQGQIVEGDFYSLSSDVLMSGIVTEDFYTIAGSLTTNGTIGADLFAITGVAQIHASVTDDVRIIGGEVTIADHVQGDVVVVGGVLKVLSSASIDGDLLFFGDRVEINGPVGGAVMGVYNTLRIDAEIGKDVDVTASTLTVGERAVITGDILLRSSNEIVRAQGATIVGEVIQKNSSAAETSGLQTVIRGKVVPILISIFAAIGLYMLLGRHIDSLILEVRHKPVVSFLFGLVSFGVVSSSLALFWVAWLVGLVYDPIAQFLQLLFIFGSLFGIIMLLAFTLLLTVSYVIVQIALGSIILKSFKKTTTSAVYTLTVGVITFHLIAYVPIIGMTFVSIITIITLGAVLRFLYRRIL